jgi:hypothetical protein
MKKTLLMCGVLLAFAAPAFAVTPNTIELSWSDCTNGVYQTNVANTCTANTGSVGTMVAAFVPPVQLDSLVALLALVDLQTSTPGVLDPWWHMDATGCGNRKGKVSPNTVFGISCSDNSGGAGTAFLVYLPNILPAPLNGARIKAGYSVVHDAAMIVTPDQLYYLVNIVFSKGGTLPAAQCPGCLDGACFVINQVNLSEPAPIPDFIINAGGLQNWVTYNGGAGPNAPCPQSTPNRKSTWGSVKSLYR